MALWEDYVGMSREGQEARPPSPTRAEEAGPVASGPGEGEPRVEAPPPRVEADEEAMRACQRAQDLMRPTLALAQRADEAAEGRPVWLSEAVPVVPGGLAMRCS